MSVMAGEKTTNQNKYQLARYLSMPKDFVGPRQADALFQMHEEMSHVKHSWSYQFAAGSAAAESGLMASHLSTDERHMRIEAANQAWQAAQSIFIFNHLSDDWSEAKLYTIPDRIEMHRSYVELYHDMIEGNVRDETMERTHQRLVEIGMANLRMHDKAVEEGDWSPISSRRGLSYELGTLTPVTRLMCPSFFAIPATARADHGEFFPDQTHDVRLIQQSWGTIQRCIPFEVKPTDGSLLEKRQPSRYKSAFVRGRIELLMPSSTEPLDLIRYMDAEQKGTISETHKRELDQITSRILTLAEQYSNRQLGGQALSA